MGSPSQQGRVGKPSVPGDHGDVKQLMHTIPAWGKSPVRRGAAGPQSQCLRAGFLQRGARRSCCHSQGMGSCPEGFPGHRTTGWGCHGGCQVKQAEGLLCPHPLPVSRSWHRCAGGRGSAPGLAGWSCPHGLQHSHTAVLGASSRPASPPGSVGRVRGGEHSLTGWEREYAPLGITPLRPTPQPRQHGKAAARCKHPGPLQKTKLQCFLPSFTVVPHLR